MAHKEDQDQCILNAQYHDCIRNRDIYLVSLGLYSLSGKTSSHQISGSLGAAGSGVLLIVSLSNLTLLPRCLSNFRAIEKVLTRNSQLPVFTGSCGKTSFCLVNRGPGIYRFQQQIRFDCIVREKTTNSALRRTAAFDLDNNNRYTVSIFTIPAFSTNVHLMMN